MNTHLSPSISPLPPSRPKRLALALGRLLAGSLLLHLEAMPARAELPVPADVLVAQGAGTVLPPVVDGNTMTIQQISDKATLDWKSFNIGVENTVRFEQPAATSVALNNIHQADPSRILGRLTANGQVFLVNQNGFLFGKDAKVNLNTLVASSLNIDAATFQRGIARAFEQGLPALAAVDGNGQPVKQLYLQDANGQPVLDANGDKVKIQVRVEAGAKLQTNASDGRIILAAPSVTNHGDIEAAGGQVILAAAQDKVYLQLADSSSGINGLLVEVGTGGEVNNLGKVLAERGNASLIGFAVNQQGITSATTSVRINGSVRLLAREGILNPSLSNGVLKPLATQRTQALDDGLGLTAAVTLGPDSLTSVDLDADKTQTAIDGQTQQASKIEISGQRVVLQENANVQAKHGNIQITAVDDPTQPTVKGAARIYLSAGSRIDVSGVKDVSLPMARNILQVELRKNEMRDAPLQKDGVLYGKTVSVDLRTATVVRDASGNVTSASIPIADIKGALDRVGRNIDERSTAGGTVTLQSTGDVIARPGSVVDFSGGSVAYQTGYVNTTKLVGADGRVYDIGEADPGRQYTSIFGEAVKTWVKWGITQRWAVAGPFGNGSTLEQGYVQGAAAGAFNISAFSAMLDGILQGGTVDGVHQRLPSDRADGGSLSIDLGTSNSGNQQNVVFADYTPIAFGVNDALPKRADGSDNPPTLNLSPSLFKTAGIRHVNLRTNGSVTISEQARLEMPVSARLTLASTGFAVEGAIIAPSGSVNLQAVSDSLPTPITLGPTALIDVRGLWLNDWLDSLNGAALSPIAIDGGQVTLGARQANLTLAAGSRIDASAGAWQPDVLPLAKTLEVPPLPTATLTAGKGGSIDLSAVTTVPGNPTSSLIMQGELAAWAMHEGGSLRLEANEVVIGPAEAVPVRAGATQTPLRLAPEFFQQGGFARYDINANVFGIRVAEGVQLAPRQYNLLLTAGAITTPTGGNPFQTTPVLLADALRQATDLSLSYSGRLGQRHSEAVRIEAGAAIKADAQAHVQLKSDTSIIVNGDISAPGGQIDLTITPPASVAADRGFDAGQGIWLGADSQLSTAGLFLPTPSLMGLTVGTVLAGGDIHLTANRGYIVTAAGSRLDASGTAATLDFLTEASDGRTQLNTRRIASQGGDIRLTAAEGILADGAFKAASGGAGVAGGSLHVELNRLNTNKATGDDRAGKIPFPDDLNPNQPQRLIVSASAAAALLPPDFVQASALDTATLNGRAWLNAAQLNGADLASLTLKTEGQTLTTQRYNSAIEFRGDVELHTQRQIILDTPSLAWAPLTTTDRGQVRLDTAYAALGSSQSRIDLDLGNGQFATTLAPLAHGGDGQLQVNAAGIDLIGGLSFDGFGAATLDSTGDVRVRGIGGTRTQKNFQGVFNLDGDLTVRADQLYPSTLTDYRINVSGDIHLQATGDTPAPVYSAGGNLQLSATNIDQHGVLQAPFGRLSLTASDSLTLAAGSVTSVSGNGLTVPFGRGSAGQYWLYPLNNQASINIVIDTPPEKGISLAAPTLALQAAANINLSGGGDLYAYEFITGPGGTYDVLDSSSAGYRGGFAVLPGVQNGLTAYDPLEFATAGLSVGDSVYLSAAAGLPAGLYTLLPAHYALLPGAYLITPQASVGELQPGQVLRDVAGTPIVAGRYAVADTDLAEARWQGFAVEAASIVRTRSEFKDYSANQFFSDKAVREGSALPQLPKDAGSLALAASTRLILEANLTAQAASGGLGGQVDISGDRLAIVGRREDLTTTDGSIALLADDLNALNAPSLLLGGKRSRDKTGQRLNISAQNLTVAANAHLRGNDIVLAAQNNLTVQAGATVASTGKTSQQSHVRVSNADSANSDGALLWVSSAQQVDALRDQSVTGQRGVLQVEAGAHLQAAGAMLLDATQDTVFAGLIDMQGGSLGLKSSKISLGAAPADSTGLVLTNPNFTLDELRLVSASDLNLYGGISLNAKRLDISAARINGFDNSGATAQLSGDTVRLHNAGASGSETGSGDGSLTITARDIVLGAGHYAVNGFSDVSLTASNALSGEGRTTDPLTQQTLAAGVGHLTVDADLTLTAASLRGAAGATTAVDASGHQLVINHSGTALGSAALGARWDLRADTIQSSGHFDLPAGILQLTALAGDVRLLDGSAIDLSGRTLTFGNLSRYAGGGSLLLSASGNIELAQGATITLAGASAAGQQASDAGRLDIRAVNGHFDWQGVIDAQGSGAANAAVAQGRVQLDVASFGPAGFSALNSKIGAAGLTESVSLRQRSGDVLIAAGDTVTARQFELQADQGAVAIDGSINAAGARSGSVSIYGRNGIRLGASGVIDAHANAAGAAGGSVRLDTVHRDDDGSGALDLSAVGAVIDVSGAGGGVIHLRSGRDDHGFNQINAELRGADPQRTQWEATQVYHANTITSTEIAQWQADTAAFMASLTQPANTAVTVLPGIEVRSSGDLTLQDRWDFMEGAWLADANDPSGNAGAWQSNWRYADATGAQRLPGFLTLRAGGDLNINASLTDAFATSPLPGLPSFLRFQDALQPGASWSYTLVADGDVHLAPRYAGLDPADPASGVVVDGLQVMVRTGTGSIDIKADGDIRFVADANNPQAAAAVYTLGRPAQYSMADVLASLNGGAAIPGIPAPNPGEAQADYLQRLDTAQMNQLLRYGYLNLSFDDIALPAARFLAEYPTQGGAIHLTAGRDISGVATGQLLTDWLVRSGSANSPAAWGINVSSDFNNETVLPSTDGSYFYFAKGKRSFNQNVGALGGGDVTVNAGGTVQDLSVMAPTTGKPFGAWNEQRQWVASGTVVNGGGDVQVNAGGDIIGGEYFSGQGRVRLQAGGSISNGASGIGLLAEVADSRFTVQARGDIQLGAAFNPTVIKQTTSPDPMTANDTYFFTYSANSQLNLLSLAGDVQLQNAVNAIKIAKGLDVSSSSGFEFAVYPAITQATALSGDIDIDQSMTLFPSPQGKLELLAGGSIGTTVANRRINVNVSDTDPALLPGVANPAQSLEGDVSSRLYLARERLDPTTVDTAITHASTPVHSGSSASSSLIAGLDIAFPQTTEFWWYLPNAARLQAGRDIRNLSYAGQNLSAADITQIQAGRDLRYDTPLDADGAVLSINRKIQLGGPGQLQVRTGRNINLGSSDGILTLGNLGNSALTSSTGASISVLAGLSDTLDIQGFISKYLGNTGKYQTLLDTLVFSDNGVTLNLTRQQKLARLASLPDSEVLALAQQVLFSEIKASATAAAAEPDESKRLRHYQIGYDAIASLFPGKTYQGDIALVFSQIKTLAGGDINLLAPGGKVDVGLAGKNGGLAKTADQLGIVVQQAGNLSALAQGDFNVNQSRVFTLFGGDIAIWSSKGNIDAGKGAKGTISAPPPITTIDKDGNPQTLFPPVVSGSGIRAVSPEDKTKRQGNVLLAAPSGIVDAGEAGIGGNNVTIAATAVVGASNIQASGSTSGVPSTVAAPVAGASAGAAAASAAKASTESVEDKKSAPAATNNVAEAVKQAFSSVHADVVGFGDCSIADVRAGKSGCGG